LKLRWKIALVAVAAMAAAYTGLAWHPAIAPVDPPAAGSFPPAVIAQGATLAAIGDCMVCHTAPGGQPFAGGRALTTPFGTIHASNITPDPDTGIGRWSLAAFTRALRNGIGRDGRHLYPALPYPHFTDLTDPDIAALYAFLMTRAPVRAETPPNALTFPANIRMTLAGWNLLFFTPGPWQPDTTETAEWNRGAYLVDAVGHCGACHTPHNAAGAEQSGWALAGGEAEGWDAPALQGRTPSGAPWTTEALTAYLRSGFAPGHGAAAGPMIPVTEALATVPEQDVRAIAIYIKSRMPTIGQPPVTPSDQRPASGVGALFAGACGNCHAPDAPMTQRGAPSLALSTAVSAPSARNTIQVILHGIPARNGLPGPAMPGFGTALSDAQIADLTQYVRTRFGRGEAWTDIETQLRDARRDGG
jgi:mono/diheme cytochrome c family protein